MLAQTGTLVAASSSGWGTDINSLPNALVRRATKVSIGESIALHPVRLQSDASQLFFASNLLLILAHGFSRASVCASLRQANKQTKYSNYTLALLCALALWIIGSLLGILLNRRLSGDRFCVSAGQDCNVR